jgi:hypothetical protein
MKYEISKEQQEVQNLIENLIRVAKRNNVVIAGFAFGINPPMISNFGNCNDAGDIKLYELLTKTCNEKRARGEAVSTIVKEVC